MEPSNVPNPREFERRRERQALLTEIAQVETLTKSIAERMKRLRLLEEDLELANSIVSSITARMKKLDIPDDEPDT
jgi:uncharacterized protein involved in exopolysaccharide biosynthesis